MRRSLRVTLAVFLAFAAASGARAAPAPALFELKLADAEAHALASSNQLKSAVAAHSAALEQADSQYSALLPHLSLSATYEYLGTVPSIPIPPPFPQITFGSNNNYSVGPVLKYTLWDSGSTRKAYHGLSKLAEARDEDRKAAKLQLLLSVRGTYVEVELALDELRLIFDSLKLARAQEHDIVSRFQAGAATRLDVVTAHRQVLGDELQFKQRQADLSSDFKDLLALLGERAEGDLSHPGPEDVDGVALVLKFEPLQALIQREDPGALARPDDRQPQIRSQALQAESAALQADSQSAQLYPVVQTSFKTSLDYPNGPIPQQINQNTIAVSLTLPLWLGDPTRHQAAEALRQSEAAQFQEDQTRVNVQRDFAKASELLRNLREQRELATTDIQQSEEVARLNYQSYKAGKISFTDVQAANNQALLSKVGAARIDAQILSQLHQLKALSGKDVVHD